MEQGLLVIKHRAEIAKVKPAEIIFTNVRRAGLAFARFDRNLGFRAVTCPLDRAQDTSLRFIRDQLQQLSIFLVRLLKGEPPISRSARVTHGISTPTKHRELKHETGNRSCQKVRPRMAPRPRNRAGYIGPPRLMNPVLPRPPPLSIGASGETTRTFLTPRARSIAFSAPAPAACRLKR